jgi:hypothetical protein
VRTSLLALACALGACSSSSATAPIDAAVPDAPLATIDAPPPDAAAPPDTSADAFPTAAHTAYPQVPDLGGPRLAHPQIVTVTFANDTRAPTLEAFAAWIVGSSWLTTVGQEYGVGPGAVAGASHRPETPAPTITSAEIEAYLADGVTDGSIPQPAAPFGLGDALYIIYYPSTTAITTTFVNGIMKRSCSDFAGYHGEVHHDGLDFAYAAIPDCNGAILGLSHLETQEAVVSHEIIEAATDARPVTAPAFQLRADPEDAWYMTFEFEVEVGDLCEAPSRYIRDSGFVATRSWSNAAAAAGGEPCVPIDPTLPVYGVTVTPAGTQQAAAGSTVTLTVNGWSSGPIADWQLSTAIFGGFHPTLVFGSNTMNTGGSTTLQVKIPATAVSGSTTGILIYSAHGTSVDATMWPVAITVN